MSGDEVVLATTDTLLNITGLIIAFPTAGRQRRLS
jgi:hypothetical protein